VMVNTVFVPQTSYESSHAVRDRCRAPRGPCSLRIVKKRHSGFIIYDQLVVYALYTPCTLPDTGNTRAESTGVAERPALCRGSRRSASKRPRTVINLCGTPGNESRGECREQIALEGGVRGGFRASGEGIRCIRVHGRGGSQRT
jgi:hypothetical protein